MLLFDLSESTREKSISYISCITYTITWGYVTFEMAPTVKLCDNHDGINTLYCLHGEEAPGMKTRTKERGEEKEGKVGK